MSLGQNFWIVKVGAAVTGLEPAKEEKLLSVFPNPSRGRFTVRLDNVKGQSAEMALSDLTGKKLWQKTVKPGPEQLLNEELQLPLEKGIYLLQVTTASGVFTRKVLAE